VALFYVNFFIDPLPGVRKVSAARSTEGRGSLTQSFLIIILDSTREAESSTQAQHFYIITIK
jgi:hypothetical protein